MDFWRAVKGAGHKEEEILNELEQLENGKSWCKFSNVAPCLYRQKTKNY